MNYEQMSGETRKKTRNVVCFLKVIRRIEKVVRRRRSVGQTIKIMEKRRIQANYNWISKTARSVVNAICNTVVMDK